MSHYYLMPFERFSERGGELVSWRAPGGDAMATLDLRPPNALIREGYGVFGYASPRTLPNSVDLGADLGKMYGESTRAALASALGIDALSSRTPSELMWDLLTFHADPAGLLGPKPIMPEVSGLLTLRFGEAGVVRRERLGSGHPHFARVLEVAREDYRKQRSFDLAHGRTHYLRYLGGLKAKYGVDERELIPSDLPREDAVSPETTITDNFNRADGEIGSSSEGWSWSEQVGDIDIVSNRAAAQNASENRMRADSDLSSDDHYSQATQFGNITGGAEVNVTCRVHASSTEYYMVWVNAEQLRLYKVSGFTLIAAKDFTLSSGDTIKVEANGSTIKGYVNGTEELSGTNTDITGNTRCGVRCWNAVAVYDNFEAADLAADPAEAACTPYDPFGLAVQNVTIGIG